MSLSSRSRQRCAGLGQCAPGLQARALKIPCARSPEACGRRSVGDSVCERLCHTILPEFGEKEPAASSPLPLRHHFGHPAHSRFGVPCDFQAAREVHWPQLGRPPVWDVLTHLP